MPSKCDAAKLIKEVEIRLIVGEHLMDRVPQLASRVRQTPQTFMEIMFAVAMSWSEETYVPRVEAEIARREKRRAPRTRARAGATGGRHA